MGKKKESIFMQMHNGTRTQEGSFYTALQKLFYLADNSNRHKLVEAFPEFFGEEVPQFGIFKQTEPDLVDKMRLHLRGYCDAHQKQITKKPYTCEIDVENYSNSYKWLSLPIQDESPETVSMMIESDVELFPNDRLAGVLLERLRTELPMGVSLDSIGIDRIETLFRFCISGSTSLEALRNVSVHNQSDSGFEDGR